MDSNMRGLFNLKSTETRDYPLQFLTFIRHYKKETKRNTITNKTGYNGDTTKSDRSSFLS